jgi:hypothetical protein
MPLRSFVAIKLMQRVFLDQPVLPALLVLLALLALLALPALRGLVRPQILMPLEVTVMQLLLNLMAVLLYQPVQLSLLVIQQGRSNPQGMESHL